MGRSLRPPIPTDPSAAAMKDAQKEAEALLAQAKRAASKIRTGARKQEKKLDAKVANLNRILPNGFTPAPNIDLLPPSIQRKIARAPQEVLEAARGVLDVFIPTPAMRQLVYDYSKFGVPLNDIRLRIVNPVTGRPVTDDTLKKYFHDEISLGQADGNISIATAAHRMATYQPAEYADDGVTLLKGEVAPNPSVLIASAKHRLKWFDNRNVNITHNNGVEPELAEALKQLTQDELRTLRDFASRRAGEKSEVD